MCEGEKIILGIVKQDSHILCDGCPAFLKFKWIDLNYTGIDGNCVSADVQGGFYEAFEQGMGTVGAGF